MMCRMSVPTLFEWAGGREAFERLTEAFYRRVRADPVVGPLFANMREEHPHHVATWLAEVFGGPPDYTDHHGGYPHMLAKHRDLGITEGQRARWAQLIGMAADDAGLPSDPEFRSAFMAYVEWGTRLALANSQPGAEPPPRAPVPRWGWGEAPPYQP
jgi:hemoglobin